MRLLSLILKKTSRCRHFALLDAQGLCIAFKSCHATPQNGHWLEVERVNLCWLGKPLPGSVRAVHEREHAQ
ncbi:hypothetical protein BFW87_22320 [Pseudomonas fluorescens]|uniref:Uncharacterized protein n=1 Tax=Pseudomonas fluorescens TaxID=294 RepID=A0A1T2YCL7_PSEFL|nr:hypothetical protein [Pseudomonas fluorescens]OPA89804.1 hypothetical protein BFW87_22320 [Pseudomonas fluorescens]